MNAQPEAVAPAWAFLFTLAVAGIALVVLIMLGVALIYFVTRRPKLAAQGNELADLREEVARLREEIERLKAQAVGSTGITDKRER